MTGEKGLLFGAAKAAPLQNVQHIDIFPQPCEARSSGAVDGMTEEAAEEIKVAARMGFLTD
jgi:hypothetical protein